jgi:hypothetical protein
MKCEICGAEVPPVVESATMLSHYQAKHPNRVIEVAPKPGASAAWGKPASTPTSTTTKANLSKPWPEK